MTYAKMACYKKGRKQVFNTYQEGAGPSGGGTHSITFTEEEVHRIHEP